MNPIRLLVDFSDPLMRRGALLAAFAAVVSTAPLAVLALALGEGLRRQAVPQTLALVALVVAVALPLQFWIARSAAEAIRGAIERRACDLRLRVVERLRVAPVRRLAHIDSGEMVAALTIGLDDAGASLAAALDAIFTGVLVAACALVVVAAADWRLALAAILPLPATLPAFYIAIGNSQTAALWFGRTRGQGSSRVLEFVESVPLLRVFGCTLERERRFRTAVELLRFRSFEAGFATLPMSVLVLLFVELGLAAMIIAGAALTIWNTLDGTAFFVALIAGIRAFQALADACDGYLRLRDAAPNISRVSEILELPDATEGAGRPEVPHGRELRLENVCFSFDRGPVLRNVTCTFPERGVTAIVGRSGAGKTALAGVIAGLWDVESGTVSVGGADLWKLPAAQRAGLVSYVFQETYLFEDTVFNNIRAGRPGVDDASVRRAVKAANCEAIIDRLPQGYNTALRSGGINLSLGERQRIAIARAFLSESPILVFDESTASLDAVSEHAVHRAIEALAREKTIVLITHRLGTVRNARQILVLASGAIVEAGTHDELLARDGEYAELWSAHERARRWKVAS